MTTNLQKTTFLNCFAIFIHLCFPIWMRSNHEWFLVTILAIEVAIVYDVWEFLKFVVIATLKDNCTE